MTREEAREILTHNWTRVDNPNYSESELDEAFFMAIEALSADAVSDAYKRGFEDCKRAYEIELARSADRELAELKEEFESAVPNCQKCAIKELWQETEKEDLVSVVRCKDCRYAMVRTEEEMNKPIKPQPILCEWFCIGVENDDYCSHGERRK